MLVFVMQVKSKEITNSWDILSKLVERCVKSACNQTSNDEFGLYPCGGSN